MNYNGRAAQRIKEIAKERNITIGKLLSECGLGINTLSQMSSRTQLSLKNITIIADYLNIPVDYLIGNTDSKEMQVSEINSDASAKLSDLENTLINGFRGLNQAGQKRVLDYVSDIKDNIKYQKNTPTTKKP